MKGVKHYLLGYLIGEEVVLATTNKFQLIALEKDKMLQNFKRVNEKLTVNSWKSLNPVIVELSPTALKNNINPNIYRKDLVITHVYFSRFKDPSKVKFTAPKD